MLAELPERLLLRLLLGTVAVGAAVGLDTVGFSVIIRVPAAVPRPRWRVVADGNVYVCCWWFWRRCRNGR